jgi:hypothetical protein
MPRKNKSPEKTIVEKEVQAYCDNMNWLVSVVDSKAVFSEKTGRYLRGMAEAGFPDMVGCDEYGNFVAIELKARGKLSTIKPKQVEYLRKAKEKGAFAVCVDSAELLHQLYLDYLPKRLRREV